MSKAGLEMLTQTTAMELAPFGVRVNAVAPSFIADTNFYNYAGMEPKEISMLESRSIKNTPVKKCC